MVVVKLSLVMTVLIVCALCQTALRPKTATCRQGSSKCRKAVVKTTLDKHIYCCGPGYTRIAASSTDENGQVTKSCYCYGEP
ncbi:hypothetical protein Btru_066148 [Bulinus truncatus]|nr:hypothetical protein Btru_066148 [Bulinus truncatus]